MRASFAHALWLPVAVVVAGCGQTNRSALRWEEAGETHESFMRGPSSNLQIRAPSPSADGAPQAPLPPGEEPSGRAIDRALAEFRSQRAAAANVSRTSPVHGSLWDSVLDEIEGAVVLAPVASDLGAFVRARVMLEVEYEVDTQRRRLLPDDLLGRIRRTLDSVDERVTELRLAGAAGTFLPAPRLTEGDLVLQEPVMPLVVTSGYGVRQDPIHGARRFHAGIDVGAPAGTPVQAAAAGLVIFAGWQGGYGRHLVIDHGDGVRTHYSHLESIFAKPGQVLQQHEVVATVGATGRATGPHLHFAVTDSGGRFIDPLSVLFLPFPHNVQGQPPALSQAPKAGRSVGRRGESTWSSTFPARSRVARTLPQATVASASSR